MISCRWVCLVAVVLAPLGCGLLGGDDLRTLQVNHYEVECSGVALSLCLLVREGDNAEYTYLYETPRGFVYEWGYLYEIVVEERERSSVPVDGPTIQRTLRRVISKQRVPAGTMFGVILTASESRVRRVSGDRYRVYDAVDFECLDTECEALAAAIASGSRILYSFEHPVEPSDPLRLVDWAPCDPQLAGSQTCFDQ